jgi:hypothetical protein
MNRTPVSRPHTAKPWRHHAFLVLAACCAVTLFSPASLAGQELARPGVNLLPNSWLFDSPQPSLTTLSSERPRAEFTVGAGATTNFTVRFTFNTRSFKGDKTILDIRDVLQVRLRQHDPKDRDRQNYPAFKMPDGSVPVLEASLSLHSAEHPDWTNMTIGIPLAMLNNPEGKHDVVLSFSGPDWKMYVDGEMLDNDFPFGYPRWPVTAVWEADPERVESTALYVPALQARRNPEPKLQATPGIQYWHPAGHNNWVGDVETCFHKGRYHVFYLYDRRHHQSKFGCGAHYFEHLSTIDFNTWTEHEAATPLEEQWECIGTGVPFVFKEQLCLSFGWHTTRVYPEAKTTLPTQWEYLKTHGRTGAFRRSDTPGFPAGATYSVSADGITNFKKSNVMFHPCENPSVYIDPNGKLKMLANYRSRGTWESESVDGGWRCVDPAFPPGGDCTIFFRWGKFDYIIGGFTGLWSEPADAPDSTYQDFAAKGWDFYDGSSVPAVTEIDNHRFLMAGWIPIRGWGGVLLIRELLQYPDGRIGSKWMEEITPETRKPKTMATKLTGTNTFNIEHSSFMLTFNVDPLEAKKGRLAVSFMPNHGERDGCELQINLDRNRAQFGRGAVADYAAQEKSLREGGAPHSAGNYAIENLLGVEQPFTVRVVVKANEKIGGSLIDAEIAGQRTMISYRPDLEVRSLRFRTDGVELKDVVISELQP